MRKALALCALACVLAAVGVAAQGAAAFEPVIIPRHRLSRLPVYPAAHWEPHVQAQAQVQTPVASPVAPAPARDPRTAWQPAGVLPARPKAPEPKPARPLPAEYAPEPVADPAVARIEADIAALAPAASATAAAASVNAARIRALALRESDSQSALGSLTDLLNKHSVAIVRNKRVTDKLTALAVRVAAELAKDEKRLNTQLNAVQRMRRTGRAERGANKIVIKQLLDRMLIARGAFQQLAGLVGENRAAIRLNKKTADSSNGKLDAAIVTLARTLKAVETRLDNQSDYLQRVDRTASAKSTASAQEVAKVEALGEFAVKVKHIVTQLRRQSRADHRRIAADHKRVAADHRAITTVNSVGKAGRQRLGDAVAKLAARMAAVEALAADYKKASAEVAGLKVGATRDTARLLALEKQLREAEHDANDAHHKADAAADAIVALTKGAKKTDAELQAVRTTANANADSAFTTADHTRRIEQLSHELSALNKRLDSAENTANKAHAHASATADSLKREVAAAQLTAAHTAGKVKENSRRASAVEDNARATDRALKGLAAVTAKLASVESGLARNTKTENALAATVNTLQSRAVALEKAAREAAVARAKAIAAAKARAAAMAASAAQAKARAVAQAQAARVQAIAKAKALQAQAQARARSAAVARQKQAVATAARAKQMAAAQAVARARAAAAAAGKKAAAARGGKKSAKKAVQRKAKAVARSAKRAAKRASKAAKRR